MHICCFTGHRDAPEKIAPVLMEAIEQHIAEHGVTEFLVGSYENFDRLAFFALVKAKKRHPNNLLYLLLVNLPKPGKVENLECFDGTLYFEGIERVPSRLAIVEMNRRMLEKSDYLISYVARDWGGAARTYHYARQLE